jgi:hypothetical protein
MTKNGFIAASLVTLLAISAGCKDMGTEPSSGPANPPSGATVSYQSHVLPILNRYGCTGCHGGTNGLTVGSVPALIAGGQHGPAVIPGDANNSILIKKMSATPPFGVRMPQGGPFLPDTTMQVIKDWINQGALNN